MSHAKILWGEGLFLRPQHFQQQDAYHEARQRELLFAAQPFAYGVSELDIDRDALRSGVLRLRRIDVRLPDGERYNAPDMDLLPIEATIDELAPGKADCVVDLAINPIRSFGGNCESPNGAGNTRFVTHVAEGTDMFSDAAPAELLTLRKQARLRAQGAVAEQSIQLPLLRLRRTVSGACEVDPDFVPPCLSIDASPSLKGHLQRMLEALQAKVNALYGFHREPARNLIEYRSGDIASFWLLHTASAAAAALAHLHANPRLHPERLFQEMLRLAGGLMTFSKHHTLDSLPSYDHGHPGPAFAALDNIIRDLLDTVISTRYVAIALSEPKPGLYSGRLDSDRIDAATRFYLGISARLSAAELIDAVPLRIKVGAPDDVDKLVLSAMGGVRINHAPQVPAAVPVRPRVSYFELDPHGALYERMLKARSISIHVPAGFEGIALELIAVIA
ncbi:MAG: type VI secretion system baseplate subunit TssK [Zoogloeaceae bacterium]|nr:type VI secretion system baseplate subunit TssK [Zoogloeaceae bacterium]MCP5238839.1 type VI secretion system baseplate subunit TssK [Zoogloeaceae bacterium]MCP5254274.1 type VI secretion system baseplate subunit TssK [Zoogloeaceae bacterium]MCW5614192.1 type VI secretion system baseplate subunit TssK [Rhodocyclaceae bacterium]